MNYCKVILAGNLTRDPETRNLPSGAVVTDFAIAYNRRWKSAAGDKREETSFIDVTMWGASGEAFARFHRKGSSAMVEGRLVQETWEDKNTGAKRSRLKVVAERWEFTDSKPAAEEAPF